MADFGLTEDIYSTNSLHYQRDDDRSEERLPIRWMALESIENNIFNEKTDVVSLIHSRKHVFTIHLCIVVIRSDMLGDIHMWRSALCWGSCPNSFKGAPHWSEIGETLQSCLL